MKKWISVAVALGILMCLGFSLMQAQWNYVKVFPNDTMSLSGGLNNTLAVSPNGHVWVAPYSNTTDSLFNAATSKYIKVTNLFEFNANGTLANNFRMFSYSGSTDTLLAPLTGYGMSTDHSGNIVMVKGSNQIRKINYLTGEQLAKKSNPLAGYTSSLTSPMVDGLDEVFITSVLPTTNVGPTALSSDFTSVAAAVDTGMYGNYSRNVSVTADGNDVYVHHIAKGTVHYHSASGTLGTYAVADTVWKELVVESAAWRPGTNQLWVSSGNVVSGMPDAPYSGYAWYGFDMTNPSSPVLKDSILWNGNTGIPADSIKNDPRPRGIAFSPDGNTAYVAAFGPSKGFIEVFNKVTAVQPVADGVVKDYELSQNYPNPFNPTTEISFKIAKSGFTSLKVYDVLGREVAELVNGSLAVGSYKVPFDASRLSSGTYIYELRSGDARLVKKMMLMK